MRAPGTLSAFLLLIAFSPALSEPAVAAGPDALEAWLPDDVVGYVKVADAGTRLEAFLQSDLRRKLEALPAVRQAKAGDRYRKLEQGLEEFRSVTGKEPLRVFQDLFGKEAIVAMRLGIYGPEVLVVSRAAGKKPLEEALGAVRKAIEHRVGHPVEGVRTTHEGETIETIGELSFSILGDVLVAASSPSTVERVIGLSAGKSSSSVKGSEAFRKVLSTLPEDAMASLIVRPRYLPDFRLPERSENPLAGLLFGGWLGALRSSDWIAASLRPTGAGLKLDVSALVGEARSEEWKKYRAFFPRKPADGLFSRLRKSGALASLHLNRDLAEWWDRKDSLLEPQAAWGLQNFAQILGMAFGGIDFRGEILPRLGSSLTLVARNQEYPDLAARPKPEIPAMAAILEIDRAEEMRTKILTAFQTIVGFVNMDRAQKGKKVGLLEVEKVGEADIQVLRLPEDVEEAGIARNFSPSISVVGSRLVLSSSVELGKLIVGEIQGAEAPAPAAAPARDRLDLDVAALRALLEANRDLLVEDNMRKNGSSREDAALHLQHIFDALGLLRDLQITSAEEGGAVRLEATLRMQPDGAGQAKV